MPNWQVLGSTSHSLMSGGTGTRECENRAHIWAADVCVWRREARLTDTLVVLHLVAGRADAPEGAVQVLAGPRRAGAGQTHALVDICWKAGSLQKSASSQRERPCRRSSLTHAVLLVRRGLVALVAEALEGAQPVDALAVPAHLALESAALVHVCKGNPDSVSSLSRLAPPSGAGARPSHPCSRCCASARSRGSRGSCRSPPCSYRCRCRTAGARTRRYLKCARKQGEKGR